MGDSVNRVLTNAHVRAHKRIQAVLADLGPNALEILATMAERMAAGSKEYGEDFVESRDYVEETLEEVVDGLEYAALQLIRLRRGKP